MREVIRWAGLPFRVALFVLVFVCLLCPGLVLVGFFSWDDAARFWHDSVPAFGRWALTYRN